MSCCPRCPAPLAPAPLFSGGVRTRAPQHPPPHSRAPQQQRAERPQPIPRAAAATSARARNPAGGRRQGSPETAGRGSRRRFLLRAGSGVGPRGGGDADPQLCASRAQPNGQVLHVLRAAAPSSHSPGERAHDARRPPGGNLKSHPVVGGIALTPRYSPRPRLDNIRPAAAPPEEPSDSEPDPPAPAPAPAPAPLPTFNNVHNALRQAVSDAPPAT